MDDLRLSSESSRLDLMPDQRYSALLLDSRPKNERSSRDSVVFRPHMLPPQSADLRRLLGPNHKVRMQKYATNADERGYVSVYEYTVDGHPIMWDYTSGLVHFTGLWKALGHNKAEIVRLIESNPNLNSVIRRIRGGFLKIQGGQRFKSELANP